MLSKNRINTSAWQDSKDGLIEAAGYSVPGSHVEIIKLSIFIISRKDSKKAKQYI